MRVRKKIFRQHLLHQSHTCQKTSTIVMLIYANGPFLKDYWINTPTHLEQNSITYDSMLLYE